MRFYAHRMQMGLSIIFVIAGLLILCPISFAQETFQARVEQLAQPHADQLIGKVIDASTGQPLPDAEVTLPDQAYSLRTDSTGEYAIPRYLGDKPLIMSVQKPGYAPFSITITENAPPVFEIRLQRTAQALVLDNKLRHLGDGSYVEQSSAATEFRKPPDGPALRIPFSLGNIVPSQSPYIQFGSIIGLDTKMAHYVTGNTMKAFASPLSVMLNNVLVASIQVNGDNQKIHIPRELLFSNRPNLLAIEAGYHYPEPGRIDYDDMELLNIVLHF